jgi:hypothetical protein
MVGKKSLTHQHTYIHKHTHTHMYNFLHYRKYKALQVILQNVFAYCAHQ